MKPLIVSLTLQICGFMMACAQENIQRPSNYNYTWGLVFSYEGKTSETLDCFEKELKDKDMFILG